MIDVLAMAGRLDIAMRTALRTRVCTSSPRSQSLYTLTVDTPNSAT